MKTRIGALTLTIALCFLRVNAQVMVKDINPADKTSSDPTHLSNVNGTLYFWSKGNGLATVGNPADGPGLWKSDGTQAGTQFIDSFFPEFLINIKDSVYFVAYYNGPPRNPTGLWKYDGGASSAGNHISNSQNLRGMTLLKSIIPRLMNTSTRTPRIMNGEVYFVFYNETERVMELCKTDGSTRGTASTGVKFKSNSALNFTVINNTFYFCAGDNTHGDELWKSDGTPNGTEMIKDINTVYTNTGDTKSSDPSHFIAVNSALFFTADDGVHGRQLWKSNGTAAGTTMVKDFGPDGSEPTSFGEFADVNGILYFTLDSSEKSKVKKGYQIGTELWKTDGTEKGTVIVKDINPEFSSYPRDLTDVNGTLFFTADDGIHGRELWNSNGSEVGTVMIKDINTKPGYPKGTADSVPGKTSRITTEGTPPPSLINVNGVLYFVADDGIHGFELWKSDGTAAGTVMVKDIKPFGNFGSEPRDLTNVNGVLYFTADDGPHGRELWKYDAPTR